MYMLTDIYLTFILSPVINQISLKINLICYNLNGDDMNIYIYDFNNSCL